MRASKSTACRVALTIFCWGTLSATGALIPGLFNTGVSTNGALVGPAQIDPHYTLIESGDPDVPGPAAYTMSPGRPVTPLAWMAEGPDSRWIAPNPYQSKGNVAGIYVFRTTFHLTGFNPNKTQILGKWATGNHGVDILLNGVSLGITDDHGFRAFSEFVITNGFIAGTNTLDFAVDNGPSPPSLLPTGVRVEMYGLVELPDESPFIFRQPAPKSFVRVGDATSLAVIAYGTPPIAYQWRLDGATIPGATNATLLLEGVNTKQEGNYTAEIRNAWGSVLSETAHLVVLDVIPGLFNTGVADDSTVLRDLSKDPHYVLITNPNGPSPNAIVHNSTTPQFDSGQWVPNSETSKWIAPRADTTEAAPLQYVYRLTFDLSGFDPTTALINGRWATDNEGSDIRLNGISTHNTNYLQAVNFTSFTITNGFLPGTNKLDFLVFNAGQSPTGLRVDAIAGGAKRAPIGGAGPKLAISSTREAIIEISWSSSGEGFVLEFTESFVPPAWRTENAPVQIVADRNAITLPASERVRFYRLRK